MCGVLSTQNQLHTTWSPVLKQKPLQLNALKRPRHPDRTIGIWSFQPLKDAARNTFWPLKSNIHSIGPIGPGSQKKNWPKAPNSRHNYYTTSTSAFYLDMSLITPVESSLGEGPPWVQVNTTGIPQHGHTAIRPDTPHLLHLLHPLHPPHPLHPLHARSSIHIYPQFFQDWCENTGQNNNERTSPDSNYLSHANTKQHNLFTATLCTSTS